MSDVLTVFVYRQPDGVTQVRSEIDDPAVVIDMLTEALRAMSDEGAPVVRQ